jgi:hypothetical protein
MGIKKLTVSFDVPIAHFLSLIEHGHSEMKIALYGDDKPVRMLQNGHAPKLLAAPKRKPRDSRGGLRAVMLQTFAADEKRISDPEKLRAAAVPAGFSAKSISNAIFVMKNDGLIRAIGRGQYRLTPEGLRQLEASHG